MLQIQQGPAARNCKGMSRRTALKAGFLGIAGLTLPDLLRMRAEGGRDEGHGRHPPLARRRAQPARNLRPQARRPRRLSRALRRHQDQGARAFHCQRDCCRTTPGTCDKMVLRPLAAPRQWRPLRRRPLDAHRPFRLAPPSACRRSILRSARMPPGSGAPIAPACRPMSACRPPRASTCFPATWGRRTSGRRTTHSTWTASRSTWPPTSTIKIGRPKVLRQLHAGAGRGNLESRSDLLDELRQGSPRPRPERHHGRPRPLSAGGASHDPGRQGPARPST